MNNNFFMMLLIMHMMQQNGGGGNSTNSEPETNKYDMLSTLILTMPDILDTWW